jgi:hypothetical protein
MAKRQLITALAILAMLAGCSGERKQAPDVSGSGVQQSRPGEQAGSAAGGRGLLSIQPPTVSRGTAVHIVAASPLPSGATIEWLVNGSVARSGVTAMFDTSSLRKGDSIQARVAGSGGTMLSDTVVVRNAPPEIRWARFVLGEGSGGSGIAVEAEGYDADGDNVQLEVEWKKNGQSAGNGSSLGVPVKRGDKLSVTITPFDGEVHGRSATITRDIKNIPPMIEGQDEFQVKGNLVTFRVRASDQDGDALSYYIKEAPPGMRIDRSTGWVRWETPPGTSGKVPFTVTVSDGAGGEATARFSVTITEQAPERAR